MKRAMKAKKNTTSKLSKKDVIIVIKTTSESDPVEQVANVETSNIEYMCNKCNEKYTSAHEITEHFKFCNDDNNLEIDQQQKSNVNQNNNITSGFIYHDSSKQSFKSEGLNDGSSDASDNPYEFHDDISENSMTNDNTTIDHCECCGEDKRTAHKAGEFQCHMCKKYYKHQTSLSKHIKLYHSDSKNAIQCEDCDLKCADEKIYLKHKEVHSPSKIFYCYSCETNFTRKYHLKRHLRQTGCGGVKKNKFPCRVCNHVFTRKDNLREHLRNHLIKGLGKKVYKCDTCTREFKCKTSLIIHLRTHTGELPFVCSNCSKRFISKAALVKHERRHTGEKPFSCKECGKSFAANETLNRHIKTHWKKKPYACKECGKTFIQNTQLQNHMAYHTGKNNFKCKYCDMAFMRKSRLDEHERFEHEGAEKINCPIEGCRKSFKQNENLKRHLLVHTDIKPYICETCKKSFRTLMQLKVHERTHRREVARSCPICPRAFIRADCLLRHMRSKHPDEYKALRAEAYKNKLAKLISNNLNDYIDANDKYSSENAISTNKRLPSSSISENEATEGEICQMSGLESNIRELLTFLIDKECLDSLGWPDCSVDNTITEVIKMCGHKVANVSKMDRNEMLCENIKILLKAVINTEAMNRLIETHTIDDVIMQLLQLGKTDLLSV